MFKRIACCAAAAMLLATTAAWAEDPYANVWTSQFGSLDEDEAYDLAADGSGYTYITGKTIDSISGGTGQWFTAKLDTDGTLLWAQQIDIGGDYIASGISVDVYGDDVYVAGTNKDAFVTKLDAATGAIDTSFGTSGVLTLDSGLNIFGSNCEDTAGGIAIAGSNSIYLSGSTKGVLFGSHDPGYYSSDAYLAKLDSSGNVTWGVQYAPTGTNGGVVANSVSVSADGGAFVCGVAYDGINGQTSLGGEDGFVIKVSSSGSTGWTTLVGDSGNQNILTSAVDYAGDLFVGGKQGTATSFVSKLDSDTGAVLWSQQLISGGYNDAVDAVAVDGWGDLYVVGSTDGSLFGTLNCYVDVFLAKYDGDTGDLVWGFQFGAGEDIHGTGVDTDLVGNVYLCGNVCDFNNYPNFLEVLVAKYSGDNGKYLPGDANCDGTVDISDLTVLSQNWEDYSEVKTWAQGNFNGDDYVDISDLTILGQYWGLSTSSFEEALASIGTVPEPATFAMLIAGLVGLVAYAWRKR